MPFEPLTPAIPDAPACRTGDDPPAADTPPAPEPLVALLLPPFVPIPDSSKLSS
jgi:hypothetical protein